MTKSELHQMVDRLPAESIDAAGVLLERALDPAGALLLAAPYDDEAESDEERAAIENSLNDVSPSIPWEQAKQELG
jgi:hypothetical protein